MTAKSSDTTQDTEQLKTEQLFSAADAELAQAQQSSFSFEIELGQLKHLEKEAQELQVLFELSDDALADPAIEKRYVTTDRRSSQRSIESPGLLQQLRRVESALAAPVLSLRKSLAGGKSSGDPVYGANYVPPPIQPAPVSLRAKAGAVDAIYVAILAAVVAACYLHFFVPTIAGNLFNPRELRSYEALMLLSAWLPFLLVFSWLYPASCGEATAGQKAYRLRVADWMDREPSGGVLLLRSALLPLSLLLAPFTLLLRGSDPFLLHDRLTGLTVARR